MKVEKKKMAELTLCYCVTTLQVGGRRCFAVASEKEYACLLFDEKGRQLETVWDGPGGTMSAVQVPGLDGAFLATHRMYSPNHCKEASIVLCRRTDGGWKVTTLADLPGVHRFDILTRSGVNYLIACTIKSDYAYADDWRFPGEIWVCRLPQDLAAFGEGERLPLRALDLKLVNNHGYSRDCSDGIQSGIVTGQEGVFQITPPALPEEPWSIRQLLDEPTSDALLLDFDGDGVKEMLTLSPFHGDTLRVFKQKDGVFRPVFEYEKKIEFAHAICAAELGGKPLAIVGYRKGERELHALSWRDGAYCVETLDRDVGPANVLSYQFEGKTHILSANLETNEIACYTLSED